MAEFGVQAANLAPPSGAGDSPVVTPRVPIQSGAPAVATGVANIVNMLGEGFKNYQQAEQVKTQNAILGDVAQKQNVINQAVQQGTMSAQEAHVRSGAIYSEALANYPQLAEKFGQLNTVFRASTGQADTEADMANQRQTQQRIEQMNDQEASSQGYYISPQMTMQQRQAIWQAAQSNKQQQVAWEQQKQRIEFNRSTTTFNQAQEDRDNMQFATKQINDMAGSNITAFNAQAQHLVDQVQNGTMTADAAKVQLQLIRNQVNGPLQALAASGKIDAAPYKAMFDQTYNVFNDMLDPTKKAENTKAQVTEIIAKQQLNLLSDPTVKGTVATSQLLGSGSQNPMLFASNAVATQKALAIATGQPVINGQSQDYVPQIVGNAEVEKTATDTIKYGIQRLQAGKMDDGAKGLQETTNATNNMLVQTGQMFTNGMAKDPKKMVGMASFIASPEYAYMVKQGTVDPVAAQGAKKALQSTYEPAVTQAVGSKLQGTLGDSNINISSAIDVNFTGAGVSFTVRKGLSDKDAQQAQAVVDNLTTSTQAVNTVIRMGAHLDGTTDYQKYWNDNKYYILPQVYPVKPGQAIKYKGQSYTWNGQGDWADRNNWSVANGGQ